MRDPEGGMSCGHSIEWIAKRMGCSEAVQMPKLFFCRYLLFNFGFINL